MCSLICIYIKGNSSFLYDSSRQVNDPTFRSAPGVDNSGCPSTTTSSKKLVEPCHYNANAPNTRQISGPPPSELDGPGLYAPKSLYSLQGRDALTNPIQHGFQTSPLHRSALQVRLIFSGLGSLLFTLL